MTTVQENITITKHTTGGVVPGTFSQVEVTSDGRCFFGSVWLGSLVDNVDQIAELKPRIDKFNNIKTKNNELNTWMQHNLINRLDSVQQTCRFFVYIWLYQRQVKLNVSDSTLEDIIPQYFVNMCLTQPNSHYIKDRLPRMIKSTSKNYLKFKNEFITYYKSLNEFKYSAYPYAEPNVGLAQELANSLKQNITIVNPDGVINEEATYWVDMKENNKKMIYVCKLDQEHYQALIPEIPGKPLTVSRPLAKTTTVSSDPEPGSKEAANLAAVLEKSRKEAEALKNKEEEDFAAGIAASLATSPGPSPIKTAPVVLGPPTTSAPPVECSVPKTNIPIYYVVFTAPNQLGDYNYMIKQAEYKNTLFIFNDNTINHYSNVKGSGNAVIRPYNFYGFKKSGLAKPLSAGIPTGDGSNGFSTLDKSIYVINRSINDINTLLQKYKYDQIIYSGTNINISRFSGDPEELIGIGIYDVNKSVREYITQQIKCLGDFRGKLKQTTPPKNIQNAAIMLFVNNSANVVFVRDPKKKTWMLPGGRIDKKETPWAAAAREYEEETGNKLPSNLQEKNFNYYDQQHTKGEYTRIFIGKTGVKSPSYNINKVKNKETDKLECRPLSDVLANGKNYSSVILKSTEAIYNKINKEGEYLNFANPESRPITSGVVPPSTTTYFSPSTTMTAPQSTALSTKTMIPLPKTAVIPRQTNHNNIATGYPYVSTEDKIKNGYVMAANSFKKRKYAPLTSNPKRDIAMGTGAGLALLAGLTFVGGGRKETHTRKKRAGTRKHLRKTYKSSGFSLNKCRKVKKYNKTQNKRK